ISRIAGFVPDRVGHVAVIIEDQIYFMGGSRIIPPTNPIKSSTRIYNLSEEIFSINLSSQFSTSSPPYIDLTDPFARMKFGNEKEIGIRLQENLTWLNEIDNNITITSNQTLMIEVINETYNMTDQYYGKSWSYPLNQKGLPPASRIEQCGVVLYSGGKKDMNKYILFGGRKEVDSWSKIPTAFSFSWNPPPHDGSVLYIGGFSQIESGVYFDMNEYPHQSILIQPRLAHTATLTPDNNEIFLNVHFNDLYILETILLSRNKINAPSPRSHAVPVLLPSSKILYIGGVSQIGSGVDEDLIDMNEILVFDTISLTWSYKHANQSTFIQTRLAHTATLTPDNNEIIIIGGTSTAHTANLYQNFLIIAFGNITNNSAQPVEINSRIYLLDVLCKKWLTSFTPGILYKKGIVACCHNIYTLKTWMHQLEEGIGISLLNLGLSKLSSIVKRLS
ncbi:18198_t:CDS:2, partial [Dentiscutata erythropus]